MVNLLLFLWLLSHLLVKEPTSKGVEGWRFYPRFFPHVLKDDTERGHDLSRRFFLSTFHFMLSISLTSILASRIVAPPGKQVLSGSVSQFEGGTQPWRVKIMRSSAWG
jgi:hypothetical protein